MDLDLGNYERFMDIKLTRDNNITTGKIYQAGSLDYDADFEDHFRFFFFLTLLFFSCFHDSLSLIEREEETIWEKLFRSGLTNLYCVFIVVIICL